jgi:DNA-directed RNA polymerase subunit RPC12/RpoP
VTLKALERELAEADAARQRIKGEIDAAKSRKRVACNHCGKRSVVGRLTYIQTHWYREPYGCTGGDYWSAGEGRFACPHCGYENRLIYRPEIESLKRHFAEIEQRYSDPQGHSRKWVN